MTTEHGTSLKCLYLCCRPPKGRVWPMRGNLVSCSHSVLWIAVNTGKRRRGESPVVTMVTSPVHRDWMLLQTEDEVGTRRQMMPQRILWPESFDTSPDRLSVASLHGRTRTTGAPLLSGNAMKSTIVTGALSLLGGRRRRWWWGIIWSRVRLNLPWALPPRPPASLWSLMEGRERGDQQADYVAGNRPKYLIKQLICRAGWRYKPYSETEDLFGISTRVFASSKTDKWHSISRQKETVLLCKNLGKVPGPRYNLIQQSMQQLQTLCSSCSAVREALTQLCGNAFISLCCTVLNYITEYHTSNYYSEPTHSDTHLSHFFIIC